MLGCMLVITAYLITHASISGAIATNQPHFGPGTGFILLDNVGCDGNEANLTQCQHNGLGVHNCVSSEDAGVFCNTGKYEWCREITSGNYICIVTYMNVFIVDTNIDYLCN